MSATPLTHAAELVRPIMPGDGIAGFSEGGWRVKSLLWRGSDSGAGVACQHNGRVAEQGRKCEPDGACVPIPENPMRRHR